MTHSRGDPQRIILKLKSTTSLYTRVGIAFKKRIG